MDLELTGRTALVTGASGDIGAACAKALACEGVHLRLTGRNQARIDALVTTIREAGGGAEGLAGDLADEAFTKTLMATPPPDLLVHAAGHRFTYMRFHRVAPEDAALTWKIEVDAFAQLAAWALPEMMTRRFGRLVVISSLAAQTAAGGAVHYTGAKAAVEGLVRGIAAEYGRFRITANAIAPSTVETSRFVARVEGRASTAEEGEDAQAMAEHRTKLIQATSVKRLARPEEVAAPVAFLCSPKASYITGITLKIAGGADLNNLW